MKYYTFLLYTILFITITVPVAIVIFGFFDVRFEVYGNYLFWFIALALFNAILPYKVKNIFDEETSFQAYTSVKTAANGAINTLSETLPSVISDNTVIDTTITLTNDKNTANEVIQNNMAKNERLIKLLPSC